MSTTTVDQHRVRMFQCLESGQGYPFLAMAEAYLDVVPEDEEVRLFTVREYLKLGLVTPAKEWVASRRAVSELSSEFEAIEIQLSTAADGMISWSRNTKRFQKNLAALSARGVETDILQKAWASGYRRFQCSRDAHGVYQIRMRDEDARWRWIPGLSQHDSIDQSRAMPEGVGELMPGPYLFEGLDLGGYFERVYRATQNTFLGYSCALFVVEPDPTLLAVVLHLRDWEEICSDPRVYWFLGCEATTRLREAFDSDLDLPFPRQAFQLSSFRAGCQPTSVETIQASANRREQDIRQSHRDLEARYANRNTTWWAKRFDEALSGKGESLRILASVSVHTTFLQHSMRDAIRALESLGHRCVLLMEKSNHHVIGPLNYHRVIREFDPDIFFALDHFRSEFGLLVPSNLPVLTWDQDQLPHVFTPKNLSGVAKHDFVAGCCKGLWVLMGKDPRQCFHARVPTCPEQFGGPELTDEERLRYGCDVSFVSHASQTPRVFHDQERAGWADPNLRRLIDTLFELLPTALEKHKVAGGWLCEELIDEACRRCGMVIHDGQVRNRLRGWYLWRLGDRIFRHESLEWVAKWARQTGRRFRIYGSGWETHPTLAEFAAGPAENGRELLCVYRASRINLQLMPAGFIHQRALDGLAAGGFFMSRLVPGDTRGHSIRNLTKRIRELGLQSTGKLLSCDDVSLHAGLGDVYGDSLEGIRARARRSTGETDRIDLFRDIHVAAELEHPDEVFSDFDWVVFDSYEEFSTKADRFLADDQARAGITNRMRQVVLDRFSYKPTMNQFLQAMASYLKEVES
ncbi:MAG: hypothetical protein AABZ47_07760 [Planctomycetota bacterium]